MAYTLYKNITTVNRTVMNNKTNKYIVIHYTGNKTDTAKANANYFKSVNRGASAHYFVDKTTVYQVVEDKDAAWAIGVNYGEGKTNLFSVVKNSNSISIEMCSDGGKITDDTFNNTVKLTKSLMKKYNIPVSHVYRHWDVCSKTCPGWDGWGANGKDASIWNKFKANIESTSASTGTSSTSSTTSTTSTASSATSVNYKVKVNTASGINVRKGAGTKYSKVATIANGVTVTITKEQNGWGYVNKYSGWIYLKYTKKVSTSSISTTTNSSSYKVGQTYTLQSEMKVRTGAGANYRAKTYSELTSNAKTHDKDKDGCLDKGTVITCQEVKIVGNDIWVRCPSGWIAAKYNGKTYLK